MILGVTASLRSDFELELNQRILLLKTLDVNPCLPLWQELLLLDFHPGFDVKLLDSRSSLVPSFPGVPLPLHVLLLGLQVHVEDDLRPHIPKPSTEVNITPSFHDAPPLKVEQLLLMLLFFLLKLQFSLFGSKYFFLCLARRFFCILDWNSKFVLLHLHI